MKNNVHRLDSYLLNGNNRCKTVTNWPIWINGPNDAANTVRTIVPRTNILFNDNPINIDPGCRQYVVKRYMKYAGAQYK